MIEIDFISRQKDKSRGYKGSGKNIHQGHQNTYPSSSSSSLTFSHRSKYYYFPDGVMQYTISTIFLSKKYVA